MTCPCEGTTSFFPPPCPPRSVHAFFWNITLEIGLTVQEARWIANYCGVPETTVAPTTTIAKTSLTFNKTIHPSSTNTSTIPPFHPSSTITSSIPHSAGFDIWIIIIIVAAIVIFILFLAAFIIICRKKHVCGRYTNAFLPTQQISTDSTTSTTEFMVHAENYGVQEFPQENVTVHAIDGQRRKSSPVTRVNEIYANIVREDNRNDSKSSQDSKSSTTSKPTPENKNAAIFETNVPRETNVSGITVFYHNTSATKDEFQEMTFSTDTNEEEADTDSKVHDNVTLELPEIPKLFSPTTSNQSEINTCLRL